MSTTLSPPAVTANLTPTEEYTSQIPAELRSMPERWLTWNKVGDDKVPTNRGSSHGADPTNAANRGSFEEIYAAARRTGQGVGFYLGNGVVGVDLDDCRDEVTGELTADARKIVADLNSYTEITQSGTGLHIIVKAALPEPSAITDAVEIYDGLRYFVFTGRHLDGTPHAVEHRQEQTAKLFDETKAREAATHADSTRFELPDVIDDGSRNNILFSFRALTQRLRLQS